MSERASKRASEANQSFMESTVSIADTETPGLFTRKNMITLSIESCCSGGSLQIAQPLAPG